MWIFAGARVGERVLWDQHLLPAIRIGVRGLAETRGGCGHGATLRTSQLRTISAPLRSASPDIARLKLPHKQPNRSRLWLNDGSCIRLRPERPNQV